MIIGSIFIDLHEIISNPLSKEIIPKLFENHDYEKYLTRYFSSNIDFLHNPNEIELFSQEFYDSIQLCIQQHQIFEHPSVPYTCVKKGTYKFFSYHLNQLKHQVGMLVVIEFQNSSLALSCGNALYLILRRSLMQLFKEQKLEYYLKILCEEFLPNYLNYSKILNEYKFEYLEGLVILKGLHDRYENTIINFDMPYFQQEDGLSNLNQDEGQGLFNLAATYSGQITAWREGFIWIKSFTSLQTLEQIVVAIYMPQILPHFEKFYENFEKILMIHELPSALLEKLIIVFLGDKFKLAVSDAIYSRKYRKTSSYIINGTRIVDIFRKNSENLVYFEQLIEEIPESRVILVYSP